MERYSWHTGSKKTELGYKTYGESTILTPLFAHCEIYKPNRKGGHRHNHVRNATARMRKCHICGDPIVWGCEVISDWTNAEFMCRECCRNDAKDYCSAVGIHFGGVTFQTRRR